MKIPLFLFLFLIPIIFFSQTKKFTSQDKLRGSITKERVWWDLIHYDLSVKINEDKKFISGTNTIQYKVLTNHQVMQIDLQDPLKITSVTQKNKKLTFKKDGSAYFIKLIDIQTKGQLNEVTVHFEGNPVESLRPPWSGGFTWAKDKDNNGFIATTCQGIGASIWWPCKDHMYDEPDRGVSLHITPPKGLMDISNGRLKKITDNIDKTQTFHWEVVNPINNYGINANVAVYSHFKEKYHGENGELDCDYYVLPYNLKKAKEQFKQVPKMLKAFEYWFGPYPFYEDGFKLVEVPYLGMEHQSSVTYGNQYQNGYLGKDLSNTGWGLKFDFIIIHESGHEWFANNITYKDIADMWIHEGFTSYSEALFLDFYYGKEAGNAYVIGTRKNIKNDFPIIGEYNVNNRGSTDMYLKGANMIHTLRQIIDDDDKFRKILRGMNTEFYHQTVTTEQIENYISEKSGLDLKAFFNQYLRTIKIPVLEYKISQSSIKYKFTNTVKGFEIPIKVTVDGKEIWINPKSKWQVLKNKSTDVKFIVDQNFYIKSANKSKKQ